MNHKEEQQRAKAAARERKAVHVIDQAYAAWRRSCRVFSVEKSDLLRLLIAEGIAPESATRIIATGHGQNELTMTVTFD